MNNEINLLEYKKKKQQQMSEQDLEFIIEDFNIKDKKEFNENTLNFEWILEKLKNNSIIDTDCLNNNISKKNFLFWLSSIANNYCTSYFIDLSLIEDENSFTSTINLKYKDVCFSLQTIYHHNETRIKIFPLKEEKKDVINIEWIKNNKQPSNYNENRIKLIKNELTSLMDIYEVNLDVLQTIINELKK